MTNLFDTLLLHYGWEGLALCGLLLLLFFVQLYYYVFVYGALPGYKASRKQARLEKEPPISVVIAMFAEDYDFVEHRLPLFLAQQQVVFEVVIVYVGSDGDFFEDLQRIRQSFPQVVVTKIELNPRFPISPKMALNVGIKSAHYEHVIFSTTDVVPTSDRWLALMAKGFTRGEVVIGYCGMEESVPLPTEEEYAAPNRPGKVASYLIRTSRMMSSVNWLSAAVKGEPYRGIRHAVGITKKSYYATSNGFGYLNMNIGEDDLFLQKILTRDNVAVVLSPRATLREKMWGGMRWWVDQQRYYGATRRFYPHRVAAFEGWELGSRVLFLLGVAVALLFLPLELKLGALALLLFRYLFVALEVRRIGQRLGEKYLWRHYYLYDLWSPVQSLWVKILLQRKDARVWR